MRIPCRSIRWRWLIASLAFLFAASSSFAQYRTPGASGSRGYLYYGGHGPESLARQGFQPGYYGYRHDVRAYRAFTPYTYEQNVYPWRYDRFYYPRSDPTREYNLPRFVLENAIRRDTAGGAGAGMPSLLPPEPVANVYLGVPAEAEVWFNGVKMKQAGTLRHFETPRLTPGESYSYEVRARWVEDGKPITRTETVQVRAGKDVYVDLTKTAAQPPP
jgi:uncharacterized protein (TIGR03000 family)